MSSELKLRYGIRFQTYAELNPNNGKRQFENIQIPSEHNDKLEDIVREYLVCYRIVIITHNNREVIAFEVWKLDSIEYIPLPPILNVLFRYENDPFVWNAPVGFKYVKNSTCCWLNIFKEM